MFKISSQFSYFPLHMFCFSSQKVKEAAFSFFNVFKCKIYFSKTNIQFSTNISSVKEKRLTEKRSNLLIRQSRPYFLLTSANLIITGSPGDYHSIKRRVLKHRDRRKKFPQTYFRCVPIVHNMQDELSKRK